MTLHKQSKISYLTTLTIPFPQKQLLRPTIQKSIIHPKRTNINNYNIHPPSIIKLIQTNINNYNIHPHRD